MAAPVPWTRSAAVVVVDDDDDFRLPSVRLSPRWSVRHLVAVAYRREPRGRRDRSRAACVDAEAECQLRTGLRVRSDAQARCPCAWKRCLLPSQLALVPRFAMNGIVCGPPVPLTVSHRLRATQDAPLRGDRSNSRTQACPAADRRRPSELPLFGSSAPETEEVLLEH